MALRIKIDDATVTKRTIKGKEGGASFQVQSQTGTLYCGRFVYPMNIRLSDDQAPYAPGDYVVDDESFGTDEYDNVSIRRGGLKMKSALSEAVRRPAAS
jgi:Helix-destabilising protein